MIGQTIDYLRGKEIPSDKPDYASVAQYSDII